MNVNMHIKQNFAEIFQKDFPRTVNAIPNAAEHLSGTEGLDVYVINDFPANIGTADLIDADISMEYVGDVYHQIRKFVETGKMEPITTELSGNIDLPLSTQSPIIIFSDDSIDGMASPVLVIITGNLDYFNGSDAPHYARTADIVLSQMLTKAYVPNEIENPIKCLDRYDDTISCACDMDLMRDVGSSQYYGAMVEFYAVDFAAVVPSDLYPLHGQNVMSFSDPETDMADTNLFYNASTMTIWGSTYANDCVIADMLHNMAESAHFFAFEYWLNGNTMTDNYRMVILLNSNMLASDERYNVIPKLSVGLGDNFDLDEISKRWSYLVTCPIIYTNEVCEEHFSKFVPNLTDADVDRIITKIRTQTYYVADYIKLCNAITEFQTVGDFYDGIYFGEDGLETCLEGDHPELAKVVVFAGESGTEYGLYINLEAIDNDPSTAMHDIANEVKDLTERLKRMENVADDLD